MPTLTKLIKDEREGNEGRKTWRANNVDPYKDDAVAMLDGAIRTIDVLLDRLDDLRIEPQPTEEG